MASRPGRGRLRIPNTRFGAAALVGAVGLFGFGIGVFLLVVVPSARQGVGPFGFLQRFFGKPSVESRLRLPLQQPFPTPPNDRPELWLTPTVVASAFPSAQRLAEVSTSKGGAAALYDPRQNRPVVVSSPVADALGRPVYSVILAMGADTDLRTPGPSRPIPGEPTQITVAVSTVDPGDAAGCVLVPRGDALEAIAVLGSAQVDECQQGIIRLTSGSHVSFALQYDQLPNYRAADGSWREGLVFARVEVKAALTADQPA